MLRKVYKSCNFRAGHSTAVLVLECESTDHTESILFSLKYIFVNPIAAVQEITNEKNLWPLIIISPLIGILLYWLIVLLGYQALGWQAIVPLIGLTVIHGNR